MSPTESTNSMICNKGVCWGNRRLVTLVKQHKHACNKQFTERQWDQQHQVKWEDTRVLNRARPIQIKVKEALHTAANNSLNRDGDYELLGCWIASMKKLGGQDQL